MKTNLLRNNVVDFSERKASIVDQQIELIREINSIIKNSPLGGNLQLTLTSKELQIEQDEILVQEVDVENRKMILTPININDLNMDDLIHETQVIKLKDEKSFNFLETITLGNKPSKPLPKCLIRNDLRGNKVHIYD